MGTSLSCNLCRHLRAEAKSTFSKSRCSTSAVCGHPELPLISLRALSSVEPGVMPPSDHWRLLRFTKLTHVLRRAFVPKSGIWPALRSFHTRRCGGLRRDDFGGDVREAADHVSATTSLGLQGTGICCGPVLQSPPVWFRCIPKVFAKWLLKEYGQKSTSVVTHG